jgi:L-aminopeptidase/D-esterase-like protein
VPRSPIVPSAILYDLANGGAKTWGEAPPYQALARQAYAGRSQNVAQGNAGAGMGAVAGALKGGQGSASVQSGDGYTVAALACVNCFGSTTMPKQRAFWSWAYEVGSEFGAVKPLAETYADGEDWSGSRFDPQPRANTTLVCVAADAALTQSEAKRVAQMASAGLARAIRPVFAPFDGDVVFALSTGARPLAEPQPLTVARLGALGADCVARAIARAVYEADAIGVHKAWRV